MTIHDKGLGRTIFSNTVHLKAEVPGIACGKFVHSGRSELYVILACFDVFISGETML